MPLSPPDLLTQGVLAGLAVLAGTAVLLAPPPPCPVTVSRSGANPALNQVRLTVRTTGCPLPRQALVRFRTAGGGRVPYQGYTLRGGRYQISFWLSRGDVGGPGPAVEQKFGATWKTVWRLGS